MVTRKGRTARWDATIGRISVVSHHLRSLMVSINLTVSRVFVCGVEYLVVEIRETLLYKHVLQLTRLFEKNITYYLHIRKSRNNSHSSSFLIAQTFKPLVVLAESPYFARVMVFLRYSR